MHRATCLVLAHVNVLVHLIFVPEEKKVVLEELGQFPDQPLRQLGEELPLSRLRVRLLLRRLVVQPRVRLKNVLEKKL